MDFYSRKIIGCAYGTTTTAELAVKVVENACLNVNNPSGIILHSDLGTQYTSDQIEKYLSKRKSIIYLAVRDALTIIPHRIISFCLEEGRSLSQSVQRFR
ncbi:MAG: hypothetical protein Q4F06_03080 [Eubacteriales bacterium]|nr:hypothetical protein [Eubacteriales bacterium]